MIGVVVLDRGEALLGLWMTYPRYRAKALSAAKEGPLVALLARRDGEAVGLALGEISAEGDAELLSLQVEGAARGQGVGRALFRAMEAEVRRRGARSLAIGYLDGGDAGAAFAAILAGAGWPAPVMDRLVVRCDHGMGALDWIRRPRRAPTGAEIFPWNDLRSGERATLAQADWYGAKVDPFKLEGEAGFNSVGMRWRGRVIGWVLTEQLDARTMRYSRSFADPSLRRLGVITALYVESIGQQLARADIPFANWTVPAEYPAMIAFTRKWMVPLALSAEHWMIATRRFE